MISKPFDICGLGMSMIDLIQVVDAFPSSGGVTESSDSALMGGGPVPTALCTAGKLGARTAIIDRIGADWRGHWVEKEYHQYGVDTDHLILEKGKTTSLGSVLVRKADGERHVLFSAGDFAPLATHELPSELLASTHILHLNGRHWPACLDAADQVKSTGGLVSFDGGAGRYDKKFPALLDKTDILIVARDFAEKYAQSEDSAEQLVALIQTGAKITAITDGDKGSWFATDTGDVFHQKAYPTEKVIDTTGCGDAFHGGFLYAHSQGWDVKEAASFASAVAAINATKLGGRGHLPSLSEVRALISNS